jgi:hypothetical protein
VVKVETIKQSCVAMNTLPLAALSPLVLSPLCNCSEPLFHSIGISDQQQAKVPTQQKSKAPAAAAAAGRIPTHHEQYHADH